VNRTEHSILNLVTFANEKQLRDSLLMHHLPSFTGTTTFVRREVPMGEVIPDIIYVGFRSPPKHSMWSRKWTFRHSFVLSLVRHRHRLHKETIACLCYETEERISSLLIDLQRSGAIVQNSNGSYSLSRDMSHIKACVVAVETKLRRWRDALEQAKMYRRFADESIVVMAAVYVPKQKDDLSLFRKAGVGLCAATPKGVCWVIKPKNSCPMGAEREYLIGSAARGGQTLWSCLKSLKASRQAVT